MASPSKKTQTLDIQLHIPVEIWDEIIIPKLNHDHHLRSLSLVSNFFLSLTNRNKQTLKITKPTAHFLPSLFRRFPNLKHLSFSDYRGDPVPVVLQLADFNFRLQSLLFSYHHRIPADALQHLPLGGVKSLKIRSVSTDDLLMIGNSFPCLEELDLSYVSSYYDRDDDDADATKYVTSADDEYDRGISVLTSKLKGLRRVNLDRNRRISDKGLVSLSNNCPNLEGISVKHCSKKVTLFGISSVLRACKNLKMLGLQLWGSESLDDIGEPLSQALSLSEIDIHGVAQSDELLFAVAKARLPLKSFAMGYCTGFTYAGLSTILKSHNSLHHLVIEPAEFLSDSAMIRLVKSLTEVRSVKLKHCPKISDLTLHSLIKGCPLLETIEIVRSGVGIGKRKCFRGSNCFINTKITSLNLSWTKSLGDESLKQIAFSCPNLQTMILTMCQGISANGVGEIMRNCPGLEHLEIRCCGMIKSLELAYTNTYALKSLGAAETGLNDGALIDISRQCPDLMFLDVMGIAELTSEGVGQIVDKCTKLKEINLDWCENISAQFVAQMVFTMSSLRKVIPPKDHLFSADEVTRFMRHGCYVSYPRSRGGPYYWLNNADGGLF